MHNRLTIEEVLKHPWMRVSYIFHSWNFANKFYLVVYIPNFEEKNVHEKIEVLFAVWTKKLFACGLTDSN